MHGSSSTGKGASTKRSIDRVKGQTAARNWWIQHLLGSPTKQRDPQILRTLDVSQQLRSLAKCMEANKTMAIATENGSAYGKKTERHLADAQSHHAKAEKKTKSNLTRWKPKFTRAGEEYCKAAVLFHQAGNIDECKTNLLKACECFKKKRAWYSAAKTLEQAMMISLNQGDLTAVTELAWRSAALFRKAGQPDSAAQLLERASKSIEVKQPYNSELMLEKAAETVETENRPIQAASYITKLLKIALRKKDKKDAMKKARKLVELYQEAGHKPSTGRSVLGLVILLLDTGLPGEAEIVAREFGNNCTLDQNVLMEDLLDAFDQNDEAKIHKALDNKCLLTLDVEFKPYIDEISLPKSMSTLGIRPRSRSRRSFAKKSADDKKKEDTPKDNTSTTNTIASSNDEGEKKDINDPSEKTLEKKAPIYDGADLKLGDEKKDKVAAMPKTKIPQGRKLKNPLVKMKTQSDFGLRNKKSDRDQPSAYIDVTTDSIERHRPSQLPPPAVYVDVEGVDPLQPAYMGMTAEQWREFKRANAQDDIDAGFDMDGIGGGDFNDDGGF
eukprot:maker-scaffold646_size120253-snap-gene-0.20 protein:Tk08812 transcript:maker-scaffold646_size120253-snap-gene-0.20-mRNA-1 annotation:"gamma-soluble nsf attachment isoform x1"